MTPDQYRREGAEAMRKAALDACEDYAPERNVDFPTDPFIAQIAQVTHSMDRILAIDVDDVLANGWSVTCNGCGWLGDEEGLIGTLDAGDGEPCRACPTCGTDGNLMDTHPAAPDLHVTTPDAVARLVAAARAGLNYLENTEGEFGITLESATGLRAALAAMEASHDPR